MDNVYTRPFKFGFSIVLFLFLILNIVSLIAAKLEYESRPFSPHDGYVWEFPLTMYRTYQEYPETETGFTVEGLAGNIIAVSIASGLVGILFEMIVGKFRSKN